MNNRERENKVVVQSSMLTNDELSLWLTKNSIFSIKYLSYFILINYGNCLYKNL